MNAEELERKLFGSHEKAVEFCQAMQELAKIWPIYSFRCSGQPYVTNQDAIDKELERRENTNEQS